MKKLARLIFLFSKQSLARTLIYRISSISVILFGTLFALSEIVSTVVYFRFSDTIAGWDIYSFFALIATFNLIEYVYQFFCVLSHESLMDKILYGELDYDLIRPIDSQIITSLKEFDYPSIINMIIPVYLLWYSTTHMALKLTFVKLSQYFIFVSIGVFLLYLLNQLFVSLSFWIERPEKLAGIPEYIFDFASRPRSIYPRVFQLIFAYLIPVITSTNLPVELLRNEMKASDLYTLVLVDLLLFILVRIQWTIGLKRYSSAN